MPTLTFPKDKYSIKKIKDNDNFEYRSFTDITYVGNPVDSIQKLNIFVPNTYFSNGNINGYNINSAPIFLPNTVGGYMPGKRDFPENTSFNNGAKTIISALKRGYVVVSAGIRGRVLKSTTGVNIGKAPALIVDLKAVIRYLKFNHEIIPGDTNRIITNGTSAGGALSALAGASGNSEFFESYLNEIGAASATDDIFAVSAYCPIHNLEHADMAYEWEFNGINDFHRMHIKFTKDGKPDFTPWDGKLTDQEKKLSSELKNEFIEYLNALNLKDSNSNLLKLSADGTGSFANFVKALLIKSAQSAFDKGENLLFLPWIKINRGRVTDIDFTEYLKFITRMKGVPAFDALDLDSPECNEFGTDEVESKHFTEFSQKHSSVKSQLADFRIINSINPLYFINDNNAVTAKHWRIRHGASDRDTSFAIPTILALTLKNNNYDVDFALPWGKPHSGDYDLPELFNWIDDLCV